MEVNSDIIVTTSTTYEQNGITTITVSAIQHDIIDDESPMDNWGISIEIDTGIVLYKYDIDEPYMRSFNRWKALISGARGISFYDGNGDGCIDCTDGNYIIVAAPSGSGGDVHATLTIPQAHLSPLLDGVIGMVYARGYKFDKR